MTTNKLVEGAYRFASGVSPGLAHKAASMPPQDVVRAGSFATRSYRREPGHPHNRQYWTVGVLADGAGSAAKAGDGAILAVEAAFQHIAQDIGVRSRHLGANRLATVMREAFFGARRELENASVQQCRPIHDYATTLLAIAVNPVAGACVAQIGDGGIVCGPPWRLAIAPHKGESREVTRFLTDDDALSHLVIKTIKPPVLNAVLFSDGLEHLLIDRDLGAHPPFFDWLAGFGDEAPPDFSELLDRDEIRERTSDDTSLVHLIAPYELRPPALRDG